MRTSRRWSLYVNDDDDDDNGSSGTSGVVRRVREVESGRRSAFVVKLQEQTETKTMPFRGKSGVREP